MIDTALALYVLLSGDSGLTTAVTDADNVVNIYGPPGLPIEFSLRKAIMYLGDGGPEDDYVPITREDFTFYCYGRESSEAREVFQALAGFFRFKRHVRFTVDGQTVIFQKATRVSGPIDQVEPIEGWPYVHCSYLLQFVEVPVP